MKSEEVEQEKGAVEATVCSLTVSPLKRERRENTKSKKRTRVGHKQIADRTRLKGKKSQTENRS